MELNYRNEMVALLGVAADATDEAIANSLTQFKSDLLKFRADTEASIAALKNSVADKDKEILAAKSEKEAFENRIKAASEELVNRDIAEFKDVITDEAAVRTQLLANREAGLTILKGLRKPAPVASSAPLHNTSIQSTPAPVVENQDEVQGNANAKRISNRAAELRKTLKVPYQQSWMMAQSEIAKTETK